MTRPRIVLSRDEEDRARKLEDAFAAQIADWCKATARHMRLSPAVSAALSRALLGSGFAVALEFRFPEASANAVAERAEVLSERAFNGAALDDA